MGSKVKDILRVAAPVALGILAPGLGTGIGTALGATGAGASALGGGILGAGGGLLTGGGLKGALLGGASGALGGYAGGGGFGNAAGSTLDTVSGISGMQGPTMGSGLVGDVTRGLSDIGLGGGSAVQGAGAGGGSSMFSGGSKLSSILGGINSLSANSEAEDDLLRAQGKAVGALNPYAATGEASNARLSELLGLSGDPSAEGYGSLGTKFSAPDFEADPGYQFRLAEGEKAMNRSLGARGGLFSGAALKAAQEHGQGVADQTYNDAYQRWRQGQQDIYNRYAGQSQQGLGAAGGMADLYGTGGSIKANAGVNQGNIINSTLSDLLSGRGALGAKQLKYDAQGRAYYG